MPKFTITLCIFLLFVAGAGYAQSQRRIGTLPQANITSRFGANFKLNTKLESRQIILSGISGAPSETDFIYQRTDLAFVGAMKTGVRSSVGAGYMIRFVSGEIVHRSIQQYAITKPYEAFRLGHRVSTDQTFRPGVPVEFRFRYRASFEIPLNGHEIDPREFYLKLNNEILFSSQKEYDVEIRGVGLFGYNLSDKNRFETGIDYRVNEFLIEFSNHNFWWVIAWYLRIE